MVVIGHGSLAVKSESDTARMLYMFIYSFHMPCFMIISGYFSKSYSNVSSKYIKRTISLFLLYIIWQATTSVYEIGIQNKNFAFNMTIARNGGWFLISLSFYTLITPLFYSLDEKFSLSVACLMGCLAGYDSTIGNGFTASRILAFLPFYLLGLYSSKENLLKLRETRLNKLVSVIILAAILLYNYLFPDYTAQHLLNGNYSYKSMRLLPWGGAYRLIWYVVATMLSLSFLSVIPKRECFITKFGKRTISVYIYSLVLYLIQGPKNKIMMLYKNLNMGFLPIAIIAVVFTFLLSWAPLERPLRILLRGDYLNKFLKTKERGKEE